MIRRALIAAVLAAAVAAPAFAAADPQRDVAGAFIAAAQAKNRKAALDLLADDVSIAYPAGASRDIQGHGEGQPFVIGYLDGLFDAKRGLSVDSATPDGDAVRFLAHENSSKARYAIEVEVRDHQVVKVTVNIEDRTALAGIDPET